MHPCLKITPVRHEPLRVRGCSPAWGPQARESGFRGEGTDRSTKTWNHLETMPEGIDQALAKSAKSWPIYLNSKPAMGTSSTHTINTLFKRKSLFKPKSQEGSSPECQSRLVAPHQEPFAPMFENHTGSRHEPLRVRGCSPAWVAASQGVLFQGRGHGSLHKDRESSPDNARGNRPSPGEIRKILADLSQLKTCHGHLHPYYKYPI